MKLKQLEMYEQSHYLQNINMVCNFVYAFIDARSYSRLSILTFVRINAILHTDKTILSSSYNSTHLVTLTPELDLSITIQYY